MHIYVTLRELMQKSCEISQDVTVQVLLRQKIYHTLNMIRFRSINRMSTIGNKNDRRGSQPLAPQMMPSQVNGRSSLQLKLEH
jgi:hypothetical protein